MLLALPRSRILEMVLAACALWSSSMSRAPLRVCAEGRGFRRYFADGDSFAGLTVRMTRRYEVRLGDPLSVTARMMCTTPAPRQGTRPLSHASRHGDFTSTFATGPSAPEIATSAPCVPVSPASG